MAWAGRSTVRTTFVMRGALRVSGRRTSSVERPVWHDTGRAAKFAFQTCQAQQEVFRAFLDYFFWREARGEGRRGQPSRRTALRWLASVATGRHGGPGNRLAIASGGRDLQLDPQGAATAQRVRAQTARSPRRRTPRLPRPGHRTEARRDRAGLHGRRPGMIFVDSLRGQSPGCVAACSPGRGQ